MERGNLLKRFWYFISASRDVCYPCWLIHSKFCFVILYLFSLIFPVSFVFNLISIFFILFRRYIFLQSSLVTFHSNPSVWGLAIFCLLCIFFRLSSLVNLIFYRWFATCAGVVWTLRRETKNPQADCFRSQHPRSGVVALGTGEGHNTNSGI